MSSFDALKAKARPARKSITLLLDGQLAAEVEQLVAERNLIASDDAMANPALEAIDAQLEALSERAAECEQEFTFEACSAHAWNRLMMEHPARPDVNEQFNRQSFVPAAIALCLVDPKLDVHEASDLGGLLSAGQWDALWLTCWLANNGGSDTVPKRVRRSVGTSNSDATPTTAAREESLTVSSSDGS